MQQKFKAGHNGKHEVDNIKNCAFHARQSAIGQLPRFYYQVLRKSWPKKENT